MTIQKNSLVRRRACGKHDREGKNARGTEEVYQSESRGRYCRLRYFSDFADESGSLTARHDSDELTRDDDGEQGIDNSSERYVAERRKKHDKVRHEIYQSLSSSP